MPDIIYRFDLTARHQEVGPATPADALTRLQDGNRRFAELVDHPDHIASIVRFDADDIGVPYPDGSPPKQTPYAVVLACSDARVPVEMILGQACNDLFVVRVAGNVLGAECLGSIDYAVSNMASLRLLVVLGHTACGAVSAAVDAFIDPSKYLQFASSHPLRAIVDRLLIAVRSGHQALETVYGQQIEAHKGYRRALVHTSVALNAALQAATLASEFEHQVGEKLQACYGVYDLATRQVRIGLEEADDLKIELAAPPKDDVHFKMLAELIAASGKVRGMVAP